MAASSIVAVLSVTVTVLVAAVALTAFRTAHAPSRSGSASGAGVSRQELIQALGVLRRAQTKADLKIRGYYPAVLDVRQAGGSGLGHTPPLLRRALARWGYPNVDRTLIRQVAVANFGTVAFAPATWQPSAERPQRAEGLIVAIRGPGANAASTGPKPTSVATLLAHGVAVAVPVGDGSITLGVVVVPDGVAKVTLGPFDFDNSGSPGRPPPIATLTSAVHDNVAAFRFSQATTRGRGYVAGTVYSVRVTAHMIWYAPNGHATKHTTVALGLFVEARGAGRSQPKPNRQGIAQTRFCGENPQAC